MATTPGAAELSSELTAEFAEDLKRIAGGARINRMCGAGDSFAEIGGYSDCLKRGGSVEENHVALRSFFGAGENRFEDGGVALGCVSSLQF